MKKQPLFVAFSNQKGGVGKSAITVLTASYLHYLKEKNIVVVDCDFPQHSTYAMRERDKKIVLKTDAYQQMLQGQFNRIKKKAYPILKAKPSDAIPVANEFLAGVNDPIDLILFDLPGSVNTPGYFDTFFNMDYVFMPIVTDRMIMQSSLSFTSIALDFLEKNKDVPLKDLYLFWNRFDKRVSTEVYTIYSKVLAHLNIKILNTILPETYRYSRELSIKGAPFFRSTLFPPMPSLLRGSKLTEFIDELITIIKL